MLQVRKTRSCLENSLRPGRVFDCIGVRSKEHEQWMHVTVWDDIQSILAVGMTDQSDQGTIFDLVIKSDLRQGRLTVNETRESKQGRTHGPES